MILKTDPSSAIRRPIESFSSASQAFERTYPGRKLSCSLTAGWTSLLVQKFESPINVEPFETQSSPDHSIVLVTKGEFEIENFSGGSWKKAAKRPGVSGLTFADNASRCRWQSKISNQHETLHIFIPQFFFSAVADEFRRAGSRFQFEPTKTLTSCDPVITQIALSLNEAVGIGAPNLYAESAAQFLATHLLSKNVYWSKAINDSRNSGALSDYRLRRVLEFMEHNFTENLTLEQLAKEAAISRFHFVRLFKKHCGATPHQYLVRIRMNAVAALLENSDLGVQEIASRCGYANFTNFYTAFRKFFESTPSEYRSKLHSNRLH
jgi:AraC family transcriptional regulator